VHILFNVELESNYKFVEQLWRAEEWKEILEQDTFSWEVWVLVESRSKLVGKRLKFFVIVHCVMGAVVCVVLQYTVSYNVLPTTVAARDEKRKERDAGKDRNIFM
jgi:hypothetical protein